MRRIALILSLSLVIAACSGGGGSTDTTVTAAVEITVAETTTTLAPTTTVTEPTEAETTPLAFETVAGTAPAVFDSFFATMLISMEIGGAAFEITAEGVWDNGSFDCTVVTDVGGFGFEQAIIATPETLWFDEGDGYEESGLFDSGAQEVMSTCPTSPLFWADFVTEDLAGITGEETTIDGRPAIKADITELMGLAGGLGLTSGFGGATINEMAMWIDVETGVAVALLADIELPEDLVEGGEGDTAGTGAMKMVMDFSLARINDPTLSVQLP